MVGMKRAVELWLLGFGKWEETVLEAILKTVSYCSASMKTIIGINPMSFKYSLNRKDSPLTEESSSLKYLSPTSQFGFVPDRENCGCHALTFTPFY